MLRKRYIIETINNMLKNMAQIVHSHHRSVNDFIMNLISASSGVEKYILHHLDKFQISKRMLEGGYIQTGEQFVQLRCMREKLQAMQ